MNDPKTIERLEADWREAFENVPDEEFAANELNSFNEDQDFLNVEQHLGMRGYEKKSVTDYLGMS